MYMPFNIVSGSWTNKARRTIEVVFRSEITCKRTKIPGKLRILEAQTTHSELQGRNWKTIKDYVRYLKLKHEKYFE